ncbi:adenylate cyclase type 4-like isoform 1-T1 [Salvelinus alpinus]
MGLFRSEHQSPIPSTSAAASTSSSASGTNLLSKPKFCSVEKIKTIGSTYMAAAGLTNPAIGDERKDCDVSYSHVRSMVEFAVALKNNLESINQHSVNSFKLRIGSVLSF